MDWASWINVVLSGAMLWLTITILKLNKTMTKIAEDEKQEKTGHDLSITLPTLYLSKNENTGVLNNFCIVNNKNRTEVIYRIYAVQDKDEIGFWLADKEPIIIPPYGCYYITKNVTPTIEILSITQIKIYAVTNDCTVELNKNVNCFNKPLEEKEYAMNTQNENIYQDYLRFRNENDTLRIQEQSKMDNIIVTCNLGLIGIAFGFMGIILDKNPNSLFYFCIAILFACLSIGSNYYSSWCSVADINKSNDILNNRYKNGDNIYNEIQTKYTKWINRFNNLAMIFLSLSVAFFFYFVYANTSIESKQKEAITMSDTKILCEGCEKNKPTTQKTIKHVIISNGAERNKPTVPKEQAQKPTSKKE